VKLLSDLEWISGFYDRNGEALFKSELSTDIEELEEVLKCLSS
jgi:hypothetical protein